MATIYCNSGAGGSNNGTSWTDAYTSLKTAVESGVTANGDVVLVHNTHDQADYSADETITAPFDCAVICVDKDSGDALSTGAKMGDQATNYSITWGGAKKVYLRGLEMWSGTGTGAGKGIVLAGTDGAHYIAELCTFRVRGNSNSRLDLGQAATLNAHIQTYVKLVNCQVDFNGTGQSLRANVGLAEVEGLSGTGSGSTPTRVFLQGAIGRDIRCEGCDFSFAGSGDLVSDAGSFGSATYYFANCKLPTGSVMVAQTTILNKSGTEVLLFNCSTGDAHHQFGHYDALGSTVAQTTIYANDGAKYDGSAGVALAITTTGNCSFYTPYVSPWIDKYHAGTSAITPTLEILRDGSATAYQNDEVWGEFSYQGTSGSTRATIVNDRMALLGSPADQTTGSLGAAGWTGENATAWFGKLNPTSTVTPAEIGHLRARVVVGEPSITVYVDPTIRT
jgi:hypothetical protein